MENCDSIFNEFTLDDTEIDFIGKPLGRGSYGEVRDIKLKKSERMLACKLIKKRKNEAVLGETTLIQELHGPYIIKIIKTIEKTIDNIDYELIIMEKALLRDLGKLNEFYYGGSLLKLIYNPFDEKCGDNLLRFYSKQIIDGLEILNRYNYVHFDLKPENILIHLNLVFKISDFGLMRNVKNEEDMKIPGGSHGYLTPEYYKKSKVSTEEARKQDYFALGSTLFFLKYGEHMIEYNKYENPVLNRERILDILDIKFGHIKSRPIIQDTFINFLINLIHFEPKDRSKFDEIYRDKWLNENNKDIEMIVDTNDNNEEKLVIELQKSDFLIQAEKDLKGKRKKKYIFKKKRNNDEN